MKSPATLAALLENFFTQRLMNQHRHVFALVSDHQVQKF